VHGDDEQKARYISDTVTGKKAWCQFFSEPGAGSDLAGLTTSAVRDGDEWIVNGQKVWTSGAQIADLGMLLARTDPDVPKHQGISYFVCDVHQPGVDIRPLKEMTGRAMFNEVFLTDVRVRHDDAIGGVNNGWAVANTTLAFERAGLSAGAGGAAGMLASAGTVAGDLGRRVGDFVGRTVRVQRGRGLGGAALLIELAKANGKIEDPIIRQDLMRLHILNEIARQTNQRAKALRAQGREIPGMGNMGKLAMSQIVRLSRDVGLRIVGPYGTLHAYTDEGRDALGEMTGQPFLTAVTESALGASAPSIYGGSDEIQHNIIGERVLGLPKEPNNDREVPFRDLPRN
jgi:alkylation response protein AidB-like acyl-CoA dehydrogenase